MDAEEHNPLKAEEVAALLARGPFSAALSQGAAMAIGAGDPARAIFATPAALKTFGVKDLAALNAAIFAAGSPGARRLRELAKMLPVGGAPRLESLRFFTSRLPIPVGWLCARVLGADGEPWLVAAAAVRGPLQAEPVDAPPIEATPLEALPETRVEMAPVAVAEPQTEPFTPPPLDGPVRFLWNLDAAGRFGAPDKAMMARLGPHAPREGESMTELDTRLSLDSEGRWTRALAAARTFSGLKLAWPEVGGARARLVSLAGAPAFDRDRQFAGFKGFGIFTGEGVALSPPPAEAPVEQPVATAAETPAPVAAAAAPPEPVVELADAPVLGIVEPTPVPDAPAALETSPDVAAPTVAADSPVEPLALAAVETASVETSSSVMESSAEPVGVAPLATFEPEAIATADMIPPDAKLPDAPKVEPASPPKSPRDGGAEIFVLRPAAPVTPPNVVPIRPGALSALTPPPPAAEPEPPRVKGDNVELSSHERDAFKEIARALGVRPRPPRGEETDAPSPPAPLEVVHTENAAPAEPPSTEEHPLATVAESHDNFRDLIDHLPIGALVMRGGEALYLNRTLLDLVGYKDLEDFRARDGLKAIFRGRDPEALAPEGDGGGMPMSTAEGEFLAVDAQARGVSWDGATAILISMRRSREAEHQSELRAVELDARRHALNARDHAAALDIAADGMIRLDASGRILAMSPGAEKLFGYNQNETAGESFLMMLAPVSQAEATQAFERLARAQGLSAEGETLSTTLRDREGQTKPARIDFGRATNADAPEYFALFRDLTQAKARECELEAAKDAAEKANASKTEFLARVSHEIRTPLHAILGFAEVIMEERFGPIGNDRYKDYIKDIHASGKHVVSLANDLLDLAKIEAGKIELEFAPVDVNQIIRECVSLMQPQAARQRIIMRLSLFDKLPNVMADERSLRQIMLNLLSNAVKYNEPGGQVIVSTALDETSQAVVRVRDTGVGMSETELGVAMQPFRRVAGGKRDVEGTGLGLPLTKALAEANHADFSIKSRKDQGTLVEVAFPSARAAQ